MILINPQQFPFIVNKYNPVTHIVLKGFSSILVGGSGIEIEVKLPGELAAVVTMQQITLK